MTNLIEFKTVTYLGKDFREYLDSQEKPEYDPEDDWKRALDEPAKPAQLPKGFTSRVLVNPEAITSCIETFSLTESQRSPKNPKFDALDLYLDNGVNITVLGTISEFNAKLEKYYAEKSA